MDQFFVLKKYRRHGVGQLLARSVFAALPGRWEVGQMPQNGVARHSGARSSASTPVADSRNKSYALAGGKASYKCSESTASDDA